MKLADFGLARNSKTITEILVGTAYYMSPEVVNEEGYTFASDIYSLGVSLYELATGKPPFYDPNSKALQVISKIANFKEVLVIPQRYSENLRNIVKVMTCGDQTKRATIKMLQTAQIKGGVLVTDERINEAARTMTKSALITHEVRTEDNKTVLTIF